MTTSKAIKNSALLIIERLSIMALSFLNAVLLARMAGVELFGQYSYLMAFVLLFSPCYALGLNNIVTHYFIRYPNNSHYYFLAAVWLRCLGALFAVVVGSICAFWFMPDMAVFAVILLVLQSASIVNLVEFYFLSKERVFITLRLRAAILITSNIVKLFVIIYFPKITWLVLVQGAEFMALGLAYYSCYRYYHGDKKIKRLPRFAVVKALFKKSKWLMLSGIAAVVYLKIDQIMLGAMLGKTQVAYYAAAVKLSEFWFVFPVMIANAFTVYLMANKKQGKQSYNKSLSHLLSLLFLLALGLVLVVYFIAPWLVTSLYGQDYQASAHILTVHIFACIFVFQRAVFSKWIIIEKLYPFSLLTHGVGAVINVLLNCLLIPKYAGVGAAWATVIAYAMAGYGALFFHHKTREFAVLMTKSAGLSFYQIPNTVQLIGKLYAKKHT